MQLGKRVGSTDHVLGPCKAKGWVGLVREGKENQSRISNLYRRGTSRPAAPFSVSAKTRPLHLGEGDKLIVSSFHRLMTSSHGYMAPLVLEGFPLDYRYLWRLTKGGWVHGEVVGGTEGEGSPVNLNERHKTPEMHLSRSAIKSQGYLWLVTP